VTIGQKTVREEMKKWNYLLPEISMSLMATAIQGSINNVVRALISRDVEAELRPKFERRTPTPACSRI
jgi:hypothetical protein